MLKEHRANTSAGAVPIHLTSLKIAIFYIVIFAQLTKVNCVTIELANNLKPIESILTVYKVLHVK